jgi:hypothetical protein
MVIQKVRFAIFYLNKITFRVTCETPIQASIYNIVRGKTGRAMAEVSRRTLTTEAWVCAQVNSCGICGEQSGTGTGLS